MEDELRANLVVSVLSYDVLVEGPYLRHRDLIISCDDDNGDDVHDADGGGDNCSLRPVEGELMAIRYSQWPSVRVQQVGLTRSGL